MKDLSLIIGEWPYDEEEEANNVRKVTGLGGRAKVQLRIRSGLLQWECDGRPDGRRPHGYPSMLDYCAAKVASDDPAERHLDAERVEELAEELFDYYRRGRALFLLGDYARSLADAVHNLKILALLRESYPDASAVYSYDRYRPGLTMDRARSAMLLHLQAGNVRGALDALNRGVRDIERFHVDYEIEDQAPDSTERQILVDLRRSLRERHNVPLNDEELMHSLEVEQEIAIRRENYEMAARLRDKINVLRGRTPGREP